MPANTVLQERIRTADQAVAAAEQATGLLRQLQLPGAELGRPRRVVAKVEWHQGELYPRVGFIVTNLSRPAEQVSDFYNGRGTAEQYIKEGKLALRWTRLSAPFRTMPCGCSSMLGYNLANFLRSLALPSQVDAERIGSLGICAGGSYALCNAQTELRVKAVAAVSTFNLGEARREAMGSLSYEERRKRLKDASEQRSREARGEPVRLVPVVPDTPDAFTANTPALYREGYEYYRTARAAHPNSPNRYAFSSLPLQMAYFPFDQLETISPRPLLVIAGSKADTLFWSEEVVQKAKAPKELYVVDGATHIDMYDKPQFVGPAVTKLNAFFGQHLASA